MMIYLDLLDWLIMILLILVYKIRAAAGNRRIDKSEKLLAKTNNVVAN